MRSAAGGQQSAVKAVRSSGQYQAASVVPAVDGGQYCAVKFGYPRGYPTVPVRSLRRIQAFCIQIQLELRNRLKRDPPLCVVPDRGVTLDAVAQDQLYLYAECLDSHPSRRRLLLVQASTPSVVATSSRRPVVVEVVGRQ